MDRRKAVYNNYSFEQFVGVDCWRLYFGVYLQSHLAYLLSHSVYLQSHSAYLLSDWVYLQSRSVYLLSHWVY